MVQEEAGSPLVVHERLQAGGVVVFSTLVEGWMVQEGTGRWNGCFQYLG